MATSRIETTADQRVKTASSQMVETLRRMETQKMVEIRRRTATSRMVEILRKTATSRRTATSQMAIAVRITRTKVLDRTKMEEMEKMKRLINFIFLMVAAFVLASCFQRTVYDEYAHTPIAGWEKNDTLSFDIPPILTTGYYQENLGLRITGAYPFTGLTLIVNQTIYPANKQEDRIEKADTVLCQLIGKDGSSSRQGISYYQYNFPINMYKMNQGDSIHITVRHDMKREILPGVSDIGVKVELAQ